VTYVIAQPCVDVMELSCVAVCPVDCIHYEPGVDRMLYIDPDECIDCAACEPECSVAAIHSEDAVPAGEEPSSRSTPSGSPIAPPPERVWTSSSHADGPRRISGAGAR